MVKTLSYSACRHHSHNLTLNYKDGKLLQYAVIFIYYKDKDFQ